MRILRVILVLCLAVPALYAQSTVDERLSKLEQEMSALRAENEQLRKQLTPTTPVKPQETAKAAETPKAAQAKPQEIKPAGKEPRLQIGGLVQFQAESGGRPDTRFSDDNDRFFLRRARINASGKFDEAFDFKVEYDATNTLAASSGLRVQLVDGYVTWTKYPGASVRVGQFKTPFGFEQLASDQQMPAAERTLGNDRIVMSRQLGVQLAGAGMDKRLSYAVGAFNGTGTNLTSNDDEGFLVAGRLAGVVLLKGNTKDPRLSLGLNAFSSDDGSVSMSSDYAFDSTPATSARDNVFSGRRNGFGADAQFNVGPVEIWTEMLRATFEPNSGLPRNDVDASSWYLQGAFPLGSKKLQGVLRYDTFDPNDSVSGDDSRSWLVGTNYFVKGHDIKLQLHYLQSERAGHDDGRVIARLQTIF